MILIIFWVAGGFTPHGVCWGARMAAVFWGLNWAGTPTMAHLRAHCLELAGSSAEAVHQNPSTWLSMSMRLLSGVARLQKAALRQGELQRARWEQQGFSGPCPGGHQCRFHLKPRAGPAFTSQRECCYLSSVFHCVIHKV